MAMRTRRILSGLSALLLGVGISVGVTATPAQAAPDVSGTLTKAPRGTTVLLVGNDGSSVSARVNRKGRFTVRPGRLAKQVFPRKGAGPTMHLVRDGRYVGPILFATKSRSKGYLRLAAKNRKPIALGRIRVVKSGFGRVAKPVKRTLLDTRRTGRLVAGAPLGAGNQGLTRPLSSSAMTIGRVQAAADPTLPAGAADLGSDADKDGVPNTADVDMNGDGVLDAAQAESALPMVGGGALSGDEVLIGRPRTATQFAKILNAAADGAAINTNRNPALSWAQLRDYLRDNLQIEVLMGRGSIADLFCDGDPNGCAEARRMAELWMDCGDLAYCLPGSAATIIAAPGSGLDGQPLPSLRGANGQLRIPLDSHTSGSSPFERGFQVGFMPRVSNDSGLQFAGDTFQFTALASDGSVMGRQVKVLTSSVATPPEWRTVAGLPATGSPVALSPQQAAGLDLEFYRPQRLTSTAGPTPVMADRGGLRYEVYLISSGSGPSSFYWCRSSQVTPTHPSLAKIRLAGEMPGRDEPLYDTDVSPGNGEPLSFRLDVTACLADPASTSGGVAGPPPSGTTMTVEMESQDSDGNRTRTRMLVVTP